MTTHGFADLPKDPASCGRSSRKPGGQLGTYAAVETPGTVRLGDRVALLD
jgi:hypothetical protein